MSEQERKEERKESTERSGILRASSGSEVEGDAGR
jgi:hypothetical protein